MESVQRDVRRRRRRQFGGASRPRRSPVRGRRGRRPSHALVVRPSQRMRVRAERAPVRRFRRRPLVF